MCVCVRVNERVKKKPVQVEGQIQLKIVHARSRLFIFATVYIGGFILKLFSPSIRSFKLASSFIWYKKMNVKKIICLYFQFYILFRKKGN